MEVLQGHHFIEIHKLKLYFVLESQLSGSGVQVVLGSIPDRNNINFSEKAMRNFHKIKKEGQSGKNTNADSRKAKLGTLGRGFRPG